MGTVNVDRGLSGRGITQSRLRSAICLIAIFSLACNRKTSEAYADHPRLVANVVLRDVTFHSSSLNREMPYRVLMPAAIPSGTKLPVVYLLHGGEGNFRDWSNFSDVA